MQNTLLCRDAIFQCLPTVMPWGLSADVAKTAKEESFTLPLFPSVRGAFTCTIRVLSTKVLLRPLTGRTRRSVRFSRQERRQSIEPGFSRDRTLDPTLRETPADDCQALRTHRPLCRSPFLPQGSVAILSLRCGRLKGWAY